MLRIHAIALLSVLNHGAYQDRKHLREWGKDYETAIGSEGIKLSGSAHLLSSGVLLHIIVRNASPKEILVPSFYDRAEIYFNDKRNKELTTKDSLTLHNQRNLTPDEGYPLPPGGSIKSTYFYPKNRFLGKSLPKKLYVEWQAWFTKDDKSQVEWYVTKTMEIRRDKGMKSRQSW